MLSKRHLADGESRCQVTTLELFRRILDDQPCLPKTAPYKDLTRVITFVLKNFFKLAQTNELLFVEVRAHFLSLAVMDTADVLPALDRRYSLTRSTN